MWPGSQRPPGGPGHVPLVGVSFADVLDERSRTDRPRICCTGRDVAGITWCGSARLIHRAGSLTSRVTARHRTSRLPIPSQTVVPAICRNDDRERARSRAAKHHVPSHEPIVAPGDVWRAEVPILGVGACGRSTIRERLNLAPLRIDADADDLHRVVVEEYPVYDVGTDQETGRDQHPASRGAFDDLGQILEP